MTERNVNPSGGEILACKDDTVCEVTSCAVCLTEIPVSVARSLEGPDYVYHFCGINCMEAWQAKADASASPSS